MKMTDRNEDDTLEALFSAARRDVAPDDAFLARLMADADQGAAENESPAPQVQRPARASWWRTWLPVSGLTAATVAGFWIGLVLPVSDIGQSFLVNTASDGVEIGAFVPSFGVDGFLEDEG